MPAPILNTPPPTPDPRTAASQTIFDTMMANFLAYIPILSSDMQAFITWLTGWNNVHLGGFATAPTVDNAGGALVNGQTYLNTTTGKLMVRSAGAWVDYSLTNSVLAFLAGLSGANTVLGFKAALALDKVLNLTPPQPNLLINGDMSVAQRAAPSVVGGAFVYSAVDGFLVSVTNATAGSAGQSGGNNRLFSGVTGLTTTSGAVLSWGFRLSAEDIAQYAEFTTVHSSLPMVLSVDINHNFASAVTFAMQLSKPSALNVFTTLTSLATNLSSQSISPGVTTRVSFLVPAGQVYDLTAGLQVVLSATIGAQTAKSIQFGNAKFEPGHVATPFVDETNDINLMRCRFRYRSGRLGVLTTGTGNSFCFPPMRITPVLSGLTIVTGTGGAVVVDSNCCAYQSVANSAISGFSAILNADLN